MTTKAALGYTAPGLPRPRNEDGLPIPWNSDADNLGMRHKRRTLRTAGGTICQVCGFRLEDDAYAFGTPDETGECDPAIGEAMPDGWSLRAMDHGLLHRVCARIAVANCPALRAMRDADRLVVFRVPPGSIEAEGADAVRVDPATL